MQYRKFGRLDFMVSALGFGAMRLPTRSDDKTDVDADEAIRMIRYAIDHGVNYVDTAYPYHGGESERVVGRALLDGYRERVRLATKLLCRIVESPDDFDRLLNEQLQKLQTDHIDFYLLHNLNKTVWPKMSAMDVFTWAEGAIADGRIGHLGFSFHDEYPLFQEIIDAYDGWTFCQIQYNYMDIEHQAGTKGLQYAASKGLAVVVMEPLRGGSLVDPPEEIQALWDEGPPGRTPVDWALNWVWNQPEATLALSGMSAMAHVEQNLASAERAAVRILTADDLALVDRVREKYKALCPIPCTQCGYCMPCPNGVDIPRNFANYNEGLMYNKPERARMAYKRWIPDEQRASACIQCRECEEKCPQSILISEWMPVVDQVMGQGEAYICELP